MWKTETGENGRNWPPARAEFGASARRDTHSHFAIPSRFFIYSLCKSCVSTVDATRKGWDVPSWNWSFTVASTGRPPNIHKKGTGVKNRWQFRSKT